MMALLHFSNRVKSKNNYRPFDSGFQRASNTQSSEWWGISIYVLVNHLYLVSTWKCWWRHHLFQRTTPLSSVQTRIPGLTHKGFILQRLSLGALSDVADLLEMRQSIQYMLSLGASGLQCMVGWWSMANNNLTMLSLMYDRYPSHSRRVQISWNVISLHVRSLHIVL